MDQDPQVVKEAKDITMSSAQILNDVGLGLTFLLEYVTRADHSELLRPEEEGQVPALQVSGTDWLS